MGRFSYSGLALVGAIPGGYLLYLLVMVFLNHTEGMKTPFLVLAGIAALVAAIVTVLPFLILIFFTEPEESPVSSAAAAGAAGAAAAAPAATSTPEPSMGDDPFSFDEPEGEGLDEFDPTGGFEGGSDGASEADDFSFDDFD